VLQGSSLEADGGATAVAVPVRRVAEASR
jgi:hypothetical protein